MNSSRSTSPPLVFVGSSGESKDVAIGFSLELKAQCKVCHVKRWDQVGIFDPSGNTLQTLISKAAEADFAVFVAAPDDVTMSRDLESPSVRDNVLFEFALFVGILGQNHTYLLTETGTPLKLPSDIAGLTKVYYESSTDPVANHDAFTDAAARIRSMIQKLGRRSAAATPAPSTPAALAAAGSWVFVVVDGVLLSQRFEEGRWGGWRPMEPPKTRPTMPVKPIDPRLPEGVSALAACEHDGGYIDLMATEASAIYKTWYDPGADRWADWDYWRPGDGPLAANSMQDGHAEFFNIGPGGALVHEWLSSHTWSGAYDFEIPGRS